MNRWLVALLGWLAISLAAPALASAAGPPFPDPEVDRSVYDEASLISPDVEAALEQRIDAIEARGGAELVIYTQLDLDISEDENLDNARALMDEWGVGRRGFDDGLVLLVGRDPDPGDTRISMFGGAGFLGAYADEGALDAIIEDEFVPRARGGDWDGAMLASVDALGAQITPDATARLGTLRVLNAALGLVGGPIALIGTLGWAWLTWRREGDDPELIDSPSILMAGPPAEMTPPLATVVRQGRATQHSLNTTLVELASSGRISFENLDRVKSARSDDEPDPLLDPAIVVHPGSDDGALAGPLRSAWKAVREQGIGGRLSRERLWSLNDELGDVREELESEAVRLGWLTRMPTPAVVRWTGIGVGEMVVGGLAIWAGLAVPMSGATLLGVALVLGGIGTVFFGRAMSKRTASGAYVDAMLTAYRRTLRKTIEQARNLQQVVEEPTVRTLADTPDKAVVWGVALGLHDELAAVIARGLADARASGTSGGAYYPVWLGSSGDGGWSSAAAGDGIVPGSGSIFSGSGIPDVGGMFDALGSVGSTPPSSSSSSSGGGGFGGGGSSGGGGASGSV